MNKRNKQQEVFVELVNLQLEPHGKTYQDVKGDPEWYMKYKTTRAAEKTFMEVGVEIIENKLGLSRVLAEKEMSWFILQWGLTTVESHNSLKEEAEELFSSKKNKKTVSEKNNTTRS